MELPVEGLSGATCSVEGFSWAGQQRFMADEGGAQQTVQRSGAAPLCVLQPRRNGVNRVVPRRPPLTPAPSEGGREGLGAGDGRGVGREGKVAWGMGGGRRQGGGRGGGGGCGSVPSGADAAGGEGLEEEEEEEEEGGDEVCGFGAC